MRLMFTQREHAIMIAYLKHNPPRPGETLDDISHRINFHCHLARSSSICRVASISRPDPRRVVPELLKAVGASLIPQPNGAHKERPGKDSQARTT